MNLRSIYATMPSTVSTICPISRRVVTCGSSTVANAPRCSHSCTGASQPSGTSKKGTSDPSHADARYRHASRELHGTDHFAGARLCVAAAGVDRKVRAQKASAAVLITAPARQTPVQPEWA